MADIKDTIVKKALQCIDEVYPDANTLNETFYPTDAFIDEAVRWVIDVTPSHRLLAMYQLNELSDATLSADGVVSIPIPELSSPFARILNIKLKDWKRAVTTAIYDTDPLYKQQHNRVLRGNPSRPVVAVCKGRTLLELYSTRCTLSQIQSVSAGSIVCYDMKCLSPSLYDLVSWKLAEIVLMAMSDTTAAAVCTARTNELLQQLAL